MNEVSLSRMGKLKLYGMQRAFESLVESRQYQTLTHDEYISMLLQAEWEDRENRRIGRSLRLARFRYHASMEDINFVQNRNLDKNQFLRFTDCSFIDRRENILITGPTGVGKSHIISALGHQACLKGYKVLYYNCQKLFASLKVARADGSWLKEATRIEKSEPKKRGRKKSVPTTEPVVTEKPVKEIKAPVEPKIKTVAKVKAEKKPVDKPVPVKKAPILKPAAKSVPVAATKVSTKKQVEPKPEPVVEVKKEVKKVEPVKKIAAKAKVVAEKKPVVKATPKKKPEAKVAAKVESVVTSLLTAPKKEVKKVVKNKSTEKKRMDEMVTSAKLTKPVSKKAPKVNVVPENPPIEPTIAPTEQL